MSTDAVVCTDLPSPGRLGSAMLDTGEWQAVGHELRLSVRERQIVALLLADAKESTMSAELGISPHTVHTHLERIYRKLGVRGRLQLAVRVLGVCLAHTRRAAGPSHAVLADGVDVP